MLVQAPAVPTVTEQPVPNPVPRMVMLAPPYVLMGTVVVRLAAEGVAPDDGVTVTDVSDDLTVPQVTDTIRELPPVRAGVVHVMEVYTPPDSVLATGVGVAHTASPMLIVQPVWNPVPVIVTVWPPEAVMRAADVIPVTDGATMFALTASTESTEPQDTMTATGPGAANAGEVQVIEVDEGDGAVQAFPPMVTVQVPMKPVPEMVMVCPLIVLIEAGDTLVTVGATLI